MAKYLKIENRSRNVLIWRKNKGSWNGTSPVDDRLYQPKTNKYFCRPSRKSPHDKTLFFAYNNFSHSIEMIEVTGTTGNFIKVRIAPISRLAYGQGDPDVILIAHNPLQAGQQIQVPVVANPIKPDHVYITNGYSNAIKLKGTLNDTTNWEQTIAPHPPSTTPTDLGKLHEDKFIEFYIEFTDEIEAAKPCRIEICIEDFSPAIVFVDCGYSEMKLTKNDHIPGNINITIVPDNP
ncbi:MAG: hypothetical protein QG657_51 [Acidobacteriota bacterium]|nr:hypothetical protein [Acidobacteriota bacterium]